MPQQSKATFDRTGDVARPDISERQRIFSTGGAARHIDVSEQTVRRSADAGIIPHWRTVRGARLFRESDLDEYVRRRADTGVELR